MIKTRFSFQESDENDHYKKNNNTKNSLFL